MPPILTVLCAASYAVLVVTPLSPPPDAEDKLRGIRLITDAALSYLGADEFLTALLSRVKESLGADTAAVLLLDRSGRHLIATAASGLEEEVRQGVRLPVGQGFAGRIAAEARPIILDHVDHSNVLNPILLEKGIRSLIGVPLLVNGAVIGVLHVGSVGSRVFTGDDTALLQMAADRAALAVQSLRSREDRAAATALQQSLLPAELPAVPGVKIAARYVPGDGRVGGDWYDVFTLPSGELCLVMGDVAGSGLEAAVIMGRMRSALRAYALETRDPAEVLTRLDRKIQHFEPAAMATVSYAVLEPATGHLHIAAAGHFPPVAAAPGRRTDLADIAVGVPIGVADNPRRQTTTLPLAPGTVLCFFTDGLVERRHTPIDDRLARLCQTVLPESPERVCVSVMRTLVGREPVGDDIALLALRWQPGRSDPIRLGRRDRRGS
jgi:sigma-B regulation protein RsbU (phosphoserine phosphatase)